MQIGLSLRNLHIGLFTENEVVFIALLSVIILVPVHRYIIRYSSIPWLSLLLFVALGFFAQSLNILRHAIAMGILLISFDYILQKKFLKFLICVALASTFHTTALAFLVLYPLSKIKLSYKYLSILFIVAVIIYILRLSILQLMNLLRMDLAVRVIDHSLLDHAGTGYGMLFMLITVFALSWYLSSKSTKDNKTTGILIHMMIIAVVLQLLSTQFSLFVRVVNFFSVSMVILIPNVIDGYRADNKKDIYMIAISAICIIAFLYHYVIVLGQYTGSPYVFVWQ